MYKKQNKPMVGVDIHKYKNTGSVLNNLNEVIGHITFDNETKGFETFLKKVVKMTSCDNPVFALEDIGGNGKALATYLNKKGYEVWAVPSTYTSKSRKESPHTEKYDEIDATRVAQSAILHKGSGKLPQFMISETSEKLQDIKGLVADRKKLIKERTALKNELHKLFNECFKIDYKDKVSYSDIFCKRALEEWLTILNKEQGNLLKFRIINKIEMIQKLNELINSLEDKLESVSENEKNIQLLQSIPGCGLVLASEIAGEISDIAKFKSSDALARYAGIAPVAYGSSGKIRHHTDSHGNRILNHALYKLAMIQITKNGFEVSRKYYAKKLKEGKSKLHSLRCLRRQLIKVIYQMLSEQTKFNPDIYEK